MNSDQIFDVIEEIAAHSGKKAKESLIAQHADDPQFKVVLQLALDPFITYGMKKVPEKTCDSGVSGHFDVIGAKGLLLRLASRDLSGNGAQEQVAKAMQALDTKSATLLARIIKKDLRAGFGASTVNKVIKGLIPEVPYMRCSLPSKVKLAQWGWARGVISQEKADGLFCNASLDAFGGLTMTTRSGNQLPVEKFPEIEVVLSGAFPASHQIHGELLVEGNGKILPREIGNGMLNSVAQGGDFDVNCRPVFRIWDMIPLYAAVPKGKYKVGYDERLVSLFRCFDKVVGVNPAVTIIETRVVHSYAAAKAHYTAMVAAGKEGTILKSKTAIWRDGTSTEQCKLKVEAECDLKVIGFEPGNGKNAATFGSVICSTRDDKLMVSVSGFSDDERVRVHENRANILGTIMAVKFNSIMAPTSPGKPHSLFLPRHVEWRTDKTEADSLERVYEQFENALAA